MNILFRLAYLLGLPALAILFLAVDFWPRFGPPDFRYTGSDPSSTVLNLGIPIAHFIYDERVSPSFIWGPLAKYLLLAELFAFLGVIISLKLAAHFMLSRPSRPIPKA